MKNYTDSDYALNKYSEGIVYRFADGSRFTVTLADYLAENPDKTETDFAALKEASDAIYLDQVRAENAQTKKNVSMHGLEDGDRFGGIPLEDEFIDALEREEALKAFYALLSSGALTETQERRFRLHVLEGLTFRETAKREGVAVRAIQKSVEAALKLLIREFNKIS
jgi:hypothetical protein